MERLDPNVRHQWDGPFLSFHKDADSLLSENFPYQIVSESSVLPSGVLLFEDADRESALAHYSSQLHINLADPDSSFVLVKIIKSMGKQRLPEGRSVTDPHLFQNPYRQQDAFPKEVEEPLQWFENYGTHYVEQVELGDVIFQVFAYSSQRFEQIRKSYQTGTNPVAGTGAVAFNYYTTNAAGSAHGFVKEYGRILSLSGCPQLEKDIQLNLWNDPVWSKDNSIFSVFEGGSLSLSQLAEGYQNAVPIRVTLREQSCLFDPSEKEKLTSLWNAILSAKYQDHVRTVFDNPYFKDYDQLAVQGDKRFISAIATPVLYREG